jgi:hypothetical protein
MRISQRELDTLLIVSLRILVALAKILQLPLRSLFIYFLISGIPIGLPEKMYLDIIEPKLGSTYLFS